MLVLSRKEGESLVIGEDIVVTVNRISGNRITLGIEAPRHVRIVRGELELKDSEADLPGESGSSPLSDPDVGGVIFEPNASYERAVG